MGDSHEPWDELEYRELFSRFPLTGPAPTGDAGTHLARRLGRSPGALIAQWDDARGYCRGSESTSASDGLKTYLDTNGLCPPR